MKDFWNQRYAEEEFAYGKQPNEFLKKRLDLLEPGTLLLPAEGEGRNALYALQKGWEVSCFDYSESAQKKAEGLIKAYGFDLDYQVTDILEYTTETCFDVLGFSYVHFPKEIRARAHKHLISFLKPGGTIIFEAFSKSQMGKPSGGPKNVDMLFSIEEIKTEFKGIQFTYLEELNIVLTEGHYHVGEASVIRFIGKKGD
ncbi:class I SAM-dependent methyltransferase [Maribacter cobaltidurans]|uniref:SAM-dependent methyltransferase n=1 Tax=Maribacter cobaltidurans TaxID=1178778 RepID=A0A223V9S1_9FLAO|nr:class I SAM-dependent methyltransferase [Maribacter cobaltidurans]ASV31718.1 SAM-dependent methyltransferase [Maribacter cobaltidurans]GGD93559.1 methyltransferase [Maribacter cobaltidurans]